MKIRHLILSFLLVISSINLFATEINISGIYKGKNLFVQNPFVGNIKDFCTINIFVNGTKVKSNPQSSAYEIDLSHLRLNDPVNIKITHKDGCKPKILNPQVVRTLSDFHFVSTTADDYSISWSTKGESVGGKHYIEYFNNGKWIIVKEIKGHVLSGISNYKKEHEHHSGTNKYRIKYMSKSHKITFSKEIEFISDMDDITFYPKRVSHFITVSRKTNYEILDTYGNVIQSGNNLKIDCSALNSGYYYLNMNNQTEKFLKK